jgi:Tol biopolymer transport system component
LVGRIVDASDPDRGIGGAYIYVPRPAGLTSEGGAHGEEGTTSEAPRRALAAGSAAGIAQADAPGTYSSENGAYRLTGIPSGQQSVVVTPPAGSGYSSIELGLDIPEGDNVVIELRITLVPSAAAGQISAVIVDPAAATVAPGSSVQFRATAFDASYEAADLAATWVVSGEIGTIDANGKFTAGASAGTGSVLAFVGGEVGRATVQVSASTPSATAPVVEASVSPQVGSVPLNVTLTCSAVDPDGAVEAVSVDWGDGSAEWTGAAFTSALTHMYRETGVYAVTARATDNAGETGYAATRVRVEARGRGLIVASYETRDMSEDFRWQIIREDGTVVRDLFPMELSIDGYGTGRVGGLRWSPDGRLLAGTWERVVAGERRYDVIITQADGSEPRLLGRGLVSGEPSFSPDGARIAYSQDGDIWTIGLDNTGATALTDTEAVFEESPDWSPDGSQIVYTAWSKPRFERYYDSENSDFLGLYVMDSDGSNRRVLYDGPYTAYHPVWSPDGTRIAFGRVDKDSTAGPFICVMNADGTGGLKARNFSPEDGSPVWSPDGTRLLFNLGARYLYTIAADLTGDPLPITEASERYYYGDWWAP